MIRIKRYTFLYPILSLLLYACAQVVSPSGGEKDIDPPQVIKTTPQNVSNNFNQKEINIQFDEFVKLNQLKQQLIVSPPLKHDLRTRLKGKSLAIEIKDTLKPNTTYVINFGDAIVDITENNPIRNFQYVFSTGLLIDSLELSGQVLDAFKLEAEKEALVMLYKQTNTDSLAYKVVPDYIARTNNEGHFKLTYIAEGEYQVVVLKDANSNLLFDRADEKIAFEERPIRLPFNQEKIRLFSFIETSKKQFIDNETWKDNQLTLSFKKPVSSLQFSFLDTSINDMLIDYRINAKKDSVSFWFKELGKQRMRFCLKDTYSSLNDTINLDFDSISSPLRLLSPLNKKLPFFKAPVLEFNRPLDLLYTNKIGLTDLNGDSINFSIENDTVLKSKCRIIFEQEADSSYMLEILPNAFQDMYGRSLKDTIRKKMDFNSLKDYGLLEVQVDLPEKNAPLIIQLLNKQGEVLRSAPLTNNTIKFTYLKPEKYRLKLILDSNNNAYWDTGDYAKGVQAEKTFIYNEDIQIRSNWDKEIKWIIR